MATLATFTSPDNVTYDLEDSWSREQINQRAEIYYVQGSATDIAGAWTGTCSGITGYYEGLTVIYSPAVSGSSNTTLNINSLGPVTCYMTGETFLSTHYGVGSSIMFTYHNEGWRHADYDMNTDINVRQTIRPNQDENRPLLMSYALNNVSSQTVDNVVYRNNDIYANPSTGTVTAVNFVGKNNGFTLGKDVYSTAELTDTKNTAGSTNTSSKIFLIGATSQANSPQTYSHDTAYVGTDGCVYSEGLKVLTSHQDISGKANLESPVFTGTPEAPTATAGTSSSQIATTAFVMSSFRANDAMLFKGTIGENGTVSALPDTHEVGWNYRVITAGTYADRVCNVGDMIICVEAGEEADDGDWTVVQSNLDGTVIGPLSSSNDHVVVFNGTSGASIKDSGFTLGKSVPADAQFTDTTYSNLSAAQGDTSVSLVTRAEKYQWNNKTTLDQVYPVGSIYMSVVSTNPGTLFGGTWEALQGRFLIGASSSYAAGSTGGAASVSYTPAGTVASHTLTVAQMPAHSHTFTGSSATTGNNSVGHTHTGPSHSHTVNSHTHSGPSHTHTGPSHDHGASSNKADYQLQQISSSTNLNNTGWKGYNGVGNFHLGYGYTSANGTGATGSAGTGATGGSSPGTNNAGTGNTGGISANHTHTVTAKGSIGNNGSGNGHSHGFTGTAASISNMPPYLSVYMWKRKA